MREYIERKIKAEKAIRISMIVVLLGIPFLITVLDENLYPVLVLSYGAFIWTMIFMYPIKYLPWAKVSGELKNYDWKDLVSDIDLDKPTLPKSKIHCGRKAFYSQKSGMVIPYHQTAWIYYKVQRSFGLVVDKTVVIYTRSGTKFLLKADDNEFIWLLENLIVPFSPGVVIGFGSEQKKRYKETRKAEMNKN